MKISAFFFALFFNLFVFVQPGTTCWREISAGTNFSMAIKQDGTLWGWGSNGNKLGLNGNMVDQNLPVQIGLANDWIKVSAGYNHTLAVKTNGTLWAWGDGQFGQLGNGTFNSATWTVTQVGTATDWLAVSAGKYFSLAIKTNGTLWSWGLNTGGQLGQNNVTNLNLPTQVGTSTNWSQIDAGDLHALALDNGGFLWAWGNNVNGEFGDATNTSSLAPILTSTTNTWGKISAGRNHSMVLDPAGSLFTMGENTNGQLGNGSNSPSNVPLLIMTSSTGIIDLFIEISAGNTFSLAIRNDGALFSTGNNPSGQLGIASNVNVNTLNQAGTLLTWDKISAGDSHSLAMETTSDLWSTGRNIEGQLGAGNFISSNVLLQVNCPTSAGIGLEENVLTDLSILLYPNPANNSISIQFGKSTANTVQLIVRDVHGKVVKSQDSKVNGNNITMDLGLLPQGFYFLEMTSKEFHECRSFHKL